MLSLPYLHPPSMPLPTTNHYTSPSRAYPNPQHPPNQNTTNNPPPLTSHHLTTLRHDETLIHNRKSNIRRFGAGWLRPPGIPKTLQGMADERAEREEQELVAQREQAMIDAQTAADEEAAEAMGQEDAALMRAAAEEGEVVDEDEMRDLDDLVPEGGGDAGWESSEGEGEGDEEEEDEEEEEGNQENERVGQAGADVVVVGDLDDGGFMGAQEEGEGDYAVPGMLEGEARDLDEDVPEAGSYQHTDTELEDESSVEEGASFAIGAGGGVLGRSVWGGSPVGVMAGGYDGPAGVERRRASRRSNGRSSRGRLSRD